MQLSSSVDGHISIMIWRTNSSTNDCGCMLLSGGRVRSRQDELSRSVAPTSTERPCGKNERRGRQNRRTIHTRERTDGWEGVRFTTKADDHKRMYGIRRREYCAVLFRTTKTRYETRAITATERSNDAIGSARCGARKCGADDENW